MRYYLDTELSTDKKNYIVKYNLKKQAFELTDILNGFDNDTVDDFFAIEDKIYLTGKKAIYFYKDSGFYFFSKSRKVFCFYDLKKAPF